MKEEEGDDEKDGDRPKHKGYHSYSSMAVEAVLAMNDRHGSSLVAIRKYIQANFSLKEQQTASFNALTLKGANKAVANGELDKNKHSYKISEQEKNRRKQKERKIQQQEKMREFKEVRKRPPSSLTPPLSPLTDLVSLALEKQGHDERPGGPPRLARHVRRHRGRDEPRSAEGNGTPQETARRAPQEPLRPAQALFE